MSTQATVLTLTCPNCGANLQIAADLETFACAYCGSRHMVQRSGGTVSLKMLSDVINRIQSGTDRTAAEMAIQRLQKEIAALQFRRGQVVNNHQLRAGAAGLQTLFRAGICGLLVAIVVGAATQNGAIAVVAFMMVSSCAGFLDQRHRKDIDAKMAAELRQVDLQIAARIEELRQHRSTVVLKKEHAG
ncbi:MAG TPA: hypothetical protein VLZ81_03680 [Blastocatellia bacterium]|nr:hypothetical protein [Blastocatellia bacterium]